jgi:hypothetical protein
VSAWRLPRVLAYYNSSKHNNLSFLFAFALAAKKSGADPMIRSDPIPDPARRDPGFLGVCGVRCAVCGVRACATFGGAVKKGGRYTLQYLFIKAYL